MNVFQLRDSMAAAPQTITVLYFAAARTTTGLYSERITLPEGGLALKDLAGVLAAKHPGTGLDKVLRTSKWSVNDEMVGEDGEEGEDLSLESVILRGGEEVAVICPVSGG